MTAHEIIEKGLYQAAVELMDDEIRESVHQDLSPCTDEEFLTEYVRCLVFEGWLLFSGDQIAQIAVQGFADQIKVLKVDPLRQLVIQFIDRCRSDSSFAR